MTNNMYARQYVNISFDPSDKRSYTYHWDGQPLLPGDKVIVDTPRDGEKLVTVTSTFFSPPPAYATKAIVRTEP